MLVQRKQLHALAPLLAISRKGIVPRCPYWRFHLRNWLSSMSNVSGT